MNTKFTPGPWIVEGRTVYALNEKGVNRFYASVQDAHTDEDELKANARLIAAAPELLAIVQKYLDSADKPMGMADIADIDAEARVVVAKAKGEA